MSLYIMISSSVLLDIWRLLSFILTFQPLVDATRKQNFMCRKETLSFSKLRKKANLGEHYPTHTKGINLVT